MLVPRSDALVSAGAALLLTGLVGCKHEAPATETHAAHVRVAAAADLSGAFEEIGREIEKSTGRKIDFTFGSTGILAKQIAEGAPFDLFAAANVSYVDQVVASGACDGATKALYAVGRIVLWSKATSGAPKRLEDLADAKITRVAIANPEHAPYGRAAKQALERAGVWGAVEKKLVYGENVQQTLAFATSGNADVAIVARSLVRPELGGEAAPIDPSLYDALEQALVVCKGDPKAGGSTVAPARELAAFIASPKGREILERHGFALPAGAAR